MTPEDKLELLDQYLAGRMSPQEAAAFEQQIQADPTLQKELAFQKQIIEGIRQARIAELKAMLNNVPVPPANPFSSASVTKIISSVIITGSVLTAVYFYFNSDIGTNKTSAEQPAAVNENPAVNEPAPDNAGEDVTAPDSATTGKEAPAPANKPAGIKTRKGSAQPPQPTLNVYIPEAEEVKQREELENRHARVVENGFVTSSIEVERAASSKHAFHYTFLNNKLILYGNFEDNLYEILEFLSGSERTVVLYYKGSYYLLDTSKDDPTPLVPIRSKSLLDKLKRYRNK